MLLTVIKRIIIAHPRPFLILYNLLLSISLVTYKLPIINLNDKLKKNINGLESVDCLNYGCFGVLIDNRDRGQMAIPSESCGS